MFINQPELFHKYESPPQILTDKTLLSDNETRKELIKTFALASSVYEDDLAEKRLIPFVHTDEDLALLEEEERNLKSKLAFIDLFGDMSGLDLDLKPEDFASEKKLNFANETA